MRFKSQNPRGSAARKFDGKEGKRGRRQDAPLCLSTDVWNSSGELRLSLIHPKTSILRKEVIQPQVPLRLPCYDFGPVADPTVAGCLLAVSAPSSGKTNSHAVTGGVYKARQRTHRSLLICDY